MPGEAIQLPPGIPRLNSYYVYLTGGCNLACKHCWLSPTFHPDGGTGGHLDYQLFALAIEEGLPLGLSHVKLTGGEPLLHPDLTRMVDLIREKGLGLTMETNGTLMTAALARYFKEKSTLGHVSVSLDGASAETHDAFRGVKGSFERACQGVRHLVEAGHRPQIIMCLYAENVGEMEALVRLAEALGAGSVKFNPVQPSGRGELMSKRQQTLDVPRLIALGRWVERELQKRTALPLFYSWPLAFQGLGRLRQNSVCNVLNILGILHDGHLALCGIGVQVPELCFGLLGRSAVAEVWTGHEVLRRLRESIPAKLEGICADCLLRARCLGNCIAQNYHDTRRLTAPYWFCTQAAQEGLFPSTRRISGETG